MMKNEFEKLAGRRVSGFEYSFIEKMYYEYKGRKEEFVNALLSDEDGIQGRLAMMIDERVSEIASEAREPYAKKVQELEGLLHSKMRENSELNRELERALKFEPYERSSMNDCEYHVLVNDECSKELTVEEAGEFISKEFGFELSKIYVFLTIKSYAKDCLGRLHVMGEKERAPIYNATDWNYVRFDVSGMSYECVDGTLHIL